MSENLKRAGSPLGDEDEEEEEEEDEYQVFTQADPVKNCSSSGSSEEEEDKPFVRSQLKLGSGCQIGVKLSRVKKKRKDFGPGNH